MITRFKDYLAKTNLAKNTVASYVWTVNYFLSHYGEVNKKNLLAYKGYLVENFKPQTVNLRLQGINKYLEFTKHDRLKVKFVKVLQKTEQTVTAKTAMLLQFRRGKVNVFFLN
ncbi:hypothetical protein QUW02_12660, partial [Bacteroides eggerthii]|nr:hypothetical protein [Bacteroides eggerthii]